MSIGIIFRFTIRYCLWLCSGTLSYIFNNFKDGRAFSEVVAEAKEAGYTEPDPRDDLSGTDVARKVWQFYQILLSTYFEENQILLAIVNEAPLCFWDIEFLLCLVETLRYSVW